MKIPQEYDRSETAERPAFFNVLIENNYKRLVASATRRTRGNHELAMELANDTVTDCLTHWRSFRPDGAFWSWMFFRFRGKLSHSAERHGLTIALFAPSDEHDGGGASESQSESCFKFEMESPPNQEHAVELKLMMGRISGVKYSEDFIRLLMGETLGEVAGGKVSNQAIEQRTRLARDIARQGLE